MSWLEETEKAAVTQPHVRSRDKQGLKLVIAAIATGVGQLQRGEVIERRVEGRRGDGGGMWRRIGHVLIQ